jgi:hypothetical protein
MPRRPEPHKPEVLRKELIELLTDFESSLANADLREKVLDLVEALRKLRDLGSSVIFFEFGENDAKSARNRILLYFQKYPRKIIHGDEIFVVSGIQEYARRIRELRVEFGWQIVSGETAKEMIKEGDLEIDNSDEIKSDTYILLNDQQDREAAHRWNIANEIRNEKINLQGKLLKYFRENVGKKITGEELKYIAGRGQSWPRRIRELRTEEGWPIKTKISGRPDLPIGYYILEEDRQSKVHDRKIPDKIRVQVLERDNYKCVKCGWTYEMNKLDDPRHLLELHHIEAHVKGGANLAENLAVLCNTCHDDLHKLDKKNEWTIEEFQSWVNG